MSRDDDYTTGNWLDYLYQQNYYELIGIDLSRKPNTGIPKRINFVGKLEEDDVWQCFYCWKAAKNNSKYFFIFLNCHRII